MSHRYRVAFRETLCGKRKSYYQNNGFSREAQSSVRETMITGAGGYDNSQLVSKLKKYFICGLVWVGIYFIIVVIFFLKSIFFLYFITQKLREKKKHKNNSKKT